ncbi:MAG TPA: phosphopantetheine-binding protein [bacterium]|nr:phosphopantetheine-binding protein [bacterium]
MTAKEETEIEQSIKKEVKKLYLKALGKEPDTNEELLSKGQDPQDLVYLFSEIEEQFGIEITNEDIKDLKTFNQVLNLVVIKTMGID